MKLLENNGKYMRHKEKRIKEIYDRIKISKYPFSRKYKF